MLVWRWLFLRSLSSLVFRYLFIVVFAMFVDLYGFCCLFFCALVVRVLAAVVVVWLDFLNLSSLLVANVLCAFVE